MKRRSQLKQVVTEVVQKATEWLDEADDKKELIETLRAVTEGKLYVELERAQLTRTLCGMLEAEGKIDEAAVAIQEVQVETIGSMDKGAKTEFILEQMRLCLMIKDFIRAKIISNKINVEKVFRKDPKTGMQMYDELKVRYYRQMIEYYNTKNEYLEMAMALFELCVFGYVFE